MQQARIAALHQVRAGVPAQYVDQAARQVIASAGYARYFGHGAGRGLHGGLSLGPHSTRPLEAGMIVTIGPGIYIPGWGGIRIEDTVVVQEHGCDALSQTTTNLVEIPLSACWPPDEGGPGEGTLNPGPLPRERAGGRRPARTEGCPQPSGGIQGEGASSVRASLAPPASPRSPPPAPAPSAPVVE